MVRQDCVGAIGDVQLLTLVKSSRGVGGSIEIEDAVLDKSALLISLSLGDPSPQVAFNASEFPLNISKRRGGVKDDTLDGEMRGAALTGHRVDQKEIVAGRLIRCLRGSVGVVGMKWSG